MERPDYSTNDLYDFYPVEEECRLTVDYAVDEPAKDRVRIRIDVDGLRVRTRLAWTHLWPQLIREPINASIRFEPFAYGFRFECIGSEGPQGRCHRLNVNYLPGEIVPAQSYYRVFDDMVELILRKKIADTWGSELYGGLAVVHGP